MATRMCKQVRSTYHFDAVKLGWIEDVEIVACLV